MTTVNLELSRQLQEIWPGRETEYYWYMKKMFGQWFLRPNFEGGFLRSLTLPDVDPFEICIAPTLDELRVFALELIGPEPEKYKPTSEDLADIFPDITEEWDKYQANINALKDALIQGCDSTALWMLNNFGSNHD